MTVFGITMVRDEEDIIEAIIQHMVEQVDHVIVADNMSTDRTRQILDSFSQITVIDDYDPAYRQSAKMTSLAMVARDSGADYVIPFDADEWWQPMVHGQTLKQVVESVGKDIVVCPMFDHVPTALDDELGHPVDRIGWRRRNRTPLHKVACRTDNTLAIAMGNHQASYAWEPTYDVSDRIVIKHFPYRSKEQFVKKAVTGGRALGLTDLPVDVGAHWRGYAEMIDKHGPEAGYDWYHTHFYSTDPMADGLVYDQVRKLTW